MNSVSKTLGVAIVLFALASPSYAQVCMEPGGSASGKVNMKCDMRYRDQLVACDNVLPPSDPKCDASKGKTPDPKCIIGTRPSCPKKPMPMITTPLKSYVQDYSGYLWHYPRDAKEPWLPYSGAYALGTPGDASRTFQIFGNTAPGTKRLASCTTQIRVPKDPTTLGEWAKLTRLQVDNCSNQYIINAAMYPVQKESTKILSLDNPDKPSQVINISGECQPLKTFTESENEYEASRYLEIAWKKTLTDASYRASTNAPLKCVPCVGGLRACDHEPHLPCQAPSVQGTSLENPINPPSPFPEVRLSSISLIPYENINDPTHPFSPRWDYRASDRDFGNLDTATIASMEPVGGVIHTALDNYMKTPKNSVFCAGVRESKETDAKKKANDEVAVDVLKFRADKFNNGLLKRAVYNDICYRDVGDVKVPAPKPFMLFPNPLPWLAFTATSWCYSLDFVEVRSVIPLVIYNWGHNEPCWKCYKLDGKVDDIADNQHPPCTTQYLGKDRRMNDGAFPFGGGLNLYSRNAQCGSSWPKICSDTRRPYTSLNVLKMRYHRTDDDDDKDGDNNVLKEGVAEGLTFGEYFTNHMPYPRMWDMNGVGLQETPATDRNNQPPTDTTGQYVAIVGVGREAASKAASDAAGADADGKTPLEKHKDERCLAGGWDPSKPKTTVTFGNVSLLTPDPITSWTELKLYEARTLHNVGMACIGRYEKVFKPGSAENMMLLRTGGRWQQLLVKKCERDKGGLTKNCIDMNYKEYVDAGSPANTDSLFYIKSTNEQSVLQPWRGYLGAKDSDNQFPNWPESGAGTDTGLDKATQGDIIMMPNGPKDDAAAGMRGLPKLAFVIETRLEKNTDCGKKKDCYIRVLEPDNGKWPDSCGTTDTWGEMKVRYLYKPGMLPPLAKAEYDRISSTSDCIETKLSQCEMSAWSKLKVYHIRDDDRKGCDKEKAVDCDKD